MTNCSSFLRMARRESRAQTVLHAALVALWALMLPLMLVTSAYALNDSNADMRELAAARKNAKAESAQARSAKSLAAKDKDARAQPINAAASRGAAHG